jgi:hypothetical protein
MPNGVIERSKLARLQGRALEWTKAPQHNQMDVGADNRHAVTEHAQRHEMPPESKRSWISEAKHHWESCTALQIQVCTLLPRVGIFGQGMETRVVLELPDQIQVIAGYF